MTTQKGFTLVELIVVILVIGILAVSVVPRLTSISGYDSLTKRDETLSVLYNVQQRAMQNTQSNSCHRVLFLPSSLGLASHSGASCSSTVLSSASGDVDDFNLVSDLTGYQAVNSAGSDISQLNFDSMGRPTVDVGSCATNGCQIIIANDTICIESEGYIHVCS